MEQYFETRYYLEFVVPVVVVSVGIVVIIISSIYEWLKEKRNNRKK